LKIHISQIYHRTPLEKTLNLIQYKLPTQLPNTQSTQTKGSNDKEGNALSIIISQRRKREMPTSLELHSRISSSSISRSSLLTQLCIHNGISPYQSLPPHRRIQRSLSIVVCRINVVEEVVNYHIISIKTLSKCKQKIYPLTMTNSNPTQLILGPIPMHNNTQPNHNPRQPRRLEDKQTQKAELDIRMFATPNIDQSTTKYTAQKHHRNQGCQAE
jgi:hypothetical protein